MRACHRCSCYVKALDARCPHCGAAASLDLRPATAVLLGLALGGCADKDMQLMYGVPYDSSMEADADGDGWSPDTDCDDDNAEIHPEATETAGDGIDSNCDGEDDT